jgi:putative transposase
MKKSKFTERWIAFALQQAEGGTQVAEECRKMGISEATFYRRTDAIPGQEVAPAGRRVILASDRGSELEAI